MTMTMCAKGVAKLVEECGELQQVLGKRLAYWGTDDHPDGTDLSVRMTEELGDVLAALRFVSSKFGVLGAVQRRATAKEELFWTWDRQDGNNEHAAL